MDRVEADRSEWQRVREMPGLAKRVVEIQQAFGLPLRGKALLDWQGWDDEKIDIDSTSGDLRFGPKGERRERLKAEIDCLAAEFSIASHHADSLSGWIVCGSENPAHMSYGLPGWRAKTVDGRRTIEIVVTPEMDIDDPMVRGTIRILQEHYRDACPQPLKDGNRLDRWRPVWEWGKWHPQVSRAEIARLLHRNPVNVRRALEELDEQVA